MGDLKEAMKAKDRERTETLRMLLAEIKNREIQDGQPVDEKAFIALIKKGTKQRKEAAEQFRNGDRLELAEKEGLAVTNGTDAILGMLCLAVDDTQRLLAQADLIAAMTVEGLLATDAPFAAELQALRPQPGQAVSAANLVPRAASVHRWYHERFPDYPADRKALVPFLW